MTISDEASSPAQRAYSRTELLSDAAVHVSGLAAAAVAVPTLITLAAIWDGSSPVVAGVSIYGASLIAMLLFSALYNMVPKGNWTSVLRRLDHSAIYFKIAGTFTPFAALSGGPGGHLLAGLWGAALAGTGLRVFAPERMKWLALGLYLAMGWVGALAGGAMLADLSSSVFGLILAGGLVYTAGFPVYLAKGLPFQNAIWHVFVLVGSVLFFIAVVLRLREASIPGVG